MKKRYTLLIAILIAFLVVPLIPMPKAATSPVSKAPEEIPYGPYLDQITFTQVSDEATALAKLSSGDIHMWLWPLDTPEAVQEAEENPNINLVDAYAGCYNLFINPLPEVEITGVGKRFNPFGIPEVREALNWYLNREFIAKEIMGGLAIPHVTVFPPVWPDYIRLYPDMKAIENEYLYDPEEAWNVIYSALTDAGCTYTAGKWYDPDGNLIEIKFYIRQEDVRKDIGNYIADELEKLGFTVDRVLCTGSKALQVVYNSISDWHLYTEGYAFTAITPYADDFPYYFYVSEYSGAVFANYTPAPTLKDLAYKLMMGEYKNEEERNQWILELTRLCLKDSSRIWVVWEKRPFPYRSELTNVAYDLTGGFYSMFTLRAAKLATGVGGNIKVGNRIMFVSAWNPIGGETWLYDTLITRYISDPGMWPHPHTGSYIPVRANFTVETVGPEAEEKIPVPEDALLFNDTYPTLDWYKVGPNVTAISKVTFHYALGKWHHGEDISVADLLDAVAHVYRIATSGDPLYDPYCVGTGTLMFLDSLKGIKVEDSNTITVYLDYWHLDETFIAALADIWTTLPWEVRAIMDAAVEAKAAAFSGPMAETWQVETIDLAKGPTLSILAGNMTNLKAQNYIPSYMKDPDLPDVAKITDDMATARWTALENWYNDKGHFYVSNGPYYLDSVDTVALTTTIKAFRDGYPFKADHWDWLVTPKVPDITVTPPEEVVPGVEATIMVTATLNGEPYNNTEIIFILLDAEGNAILRKNGELTGPGEFTITLTQEETGALTPGVYTIQVISIGKEAALAKVVTASLTVVPEIVYIERIIRDVETRLTSLIESISESLTTTSEEVSTVRSSMNIVIALVGVATAVSIISVIMAALAFKALKKPT